MNQRHTVCVQACPVGGAAMNQAADDEATTAASATGRDADGGDGAPRHAAAGERQHHEAGEAAAPE